MDYPCLEILHNGDSIITFTNLVFKDCSIDMFINTLKASTRDEKIIILLKNNFIKPEHITMCRTLDISLIVHKNEYTGELISLLHTDKI
jgi:hypothetical protein